MKIYQIEPLVLKIISAKLKRSRGFGDVSVKTVFVQKMFLARNS